MEIVRRPEQRVIGVQVEAGFADLATLVPQALVRVVDRADELPALPDGALVEHSEDLGGGRYRETVGALGASGDRVPDGMASVPLPAGGWVHHRHVGPVAQIAEGFGVIYDWARSEGLPLGRLKLDVGYSADGTPMPHDLYIVIDREDTAP
ncbi:MAG: GyrI-like domain-containing protein [Nocardioidaceae bacterium]